MLNQVDTLIAFALVMLLMSLMITVLVQVVQVIGQRRGRNLRWGVRTLFQQLGLSAREADVLSVHVLTHPAVSLDGMSLAEAISADEIIQLIEEVARRRRGKVARPAYGRIQARWQRLLGAVTDWLGKLLLVDEEAGAAGGGSALPAAGRQADDVTEAGRAARRLIRSIRKGVQPAGASAARVNEAVLPVLLDLARRGDARPQGLGLEDWLKTQTTTLEQGVEDAVSKARRHAEASRAQFVKWFDMVMDRTTERFVAHARLVTILLSFAVCFGLRIDALAILKELSTNAELRAALVSQAEGSLQDFERRIESGERAEVVARSSLEAVLAGSIEGDPAAESLRADLARRLAEDPEPPRLRSQAEAWIAARLSEPSAAELVGDPQARASFQGELLARFDERVEADLESAEGELKDTARELQQEIASLQLDLFKAFDGSELRWLRGWSLLHLCGIVVAVMFLSLGAPFWFNTLRNLSNLRPAVAKHAEQLEKSDEDKAKASGG